jgi:iron complex outermembrane receptor protein
MKLKTQFLLAALSLGVTSFAADPLAKASSAAPTAVPAVVVTASPIIDGNSVDQFGSYVTTVSADQVRDLNAVDLAAALRMTPGVSISRFNPVGSYGDIEGGAVFVRGMGSSRPGSEIKTYVDGIPFYMATWNHPLLDLLPTNGMSKIEVYKGPQPQEFGNTFAAINLTPKTAGKAQGVTGDAQVSGGSFNTWVEQTDLTGRQGAVDYSFAQGYANSDGQRASADGRLTNFMGHVGYQLNDHWSVGVLALTVKNSASDPGDIVTLANKGNQYDTSGTLAALTLAHDFEGLKGSIKVYDNNGEGLQNPGLDSRFTMSGVRLREEAKLWKGGQLSLGLDVDRLSGTVPTVGFDSGNFTLTSPYVGLSQTVVLSDGWTLTPSAGIRTYHHNQYGDENAPNVGAVLSNGKDLSFRANVSEGVNFPGIDAAILSNLMPALASTFRNLSPEKMNHCEIGAAWKPGKDTTVDVAVFQDHVTDRYVFAFSPSPTWLNVGSYVVDGGEISVQQKIGGGVSLFAGLTHLSASKSDLPYAPNNSLAVGANWQCAGWSVNLDAQVQSGMTVLSQARSDGSANTSTVNGFTVANLRVGHQLPLLGQRGEVFVSVENLFDKDYSFRPGYPMAGRSFQLGVHASF